MELIIDGSPCDMGVVGLKVPGFDAQALADVTGSREGRALKCRIPATPRNNTLLNDSRDPNTVSRFNAASHKAELSAEGAVLFAGTVRLLAAGDEGYTLEIREGGARWAREAARAMFNQLPITHTTALYPAEIQASWTDNSPVKFFPVQRDEYPAQNSSTDLITPERLLSIDDYHPFLQIAPLVEAIFTQSGYRIESSFMQSELFRSLYMSGAYASRDTTAIRSRMDFSARRISSSTATANDAGRVYADPHGISNTVGNIVHTATPQSLDTDGRMIAGLHNNGGCFVVENDQIRFTPTTEVNVGFEYYIKYTTDHRILSRDRLKGFDSVYLGTGANMTFELANRYADRRDQIAINFTYRAIVFDHQNGARYRLTATRNGVSKIPWVEFTGRSALVTTPSSGTIATPSLEVYNGTNWVSYIGDWALYDGYIGETGQTTVELRVSTAPEKVTPTASKYFFSIYFHGAEKDMRLTLHKECSLRPRFTSLPGYGSQLRFADVAQHRIRQIELIEALQHMFNLRFHTEEATKIVRIEPEDDFYGTGQEADWRAKTDFSQPVELVDIALEVHDRRTWRYIDGDGAVARFDATASSPLGLWTTRTASYAAKEGEKVLTNPLFTPTINNAGCYSNAPSALIMQIGDRDTPEDDGTNFAPRIVRYRGMSPLPAGQRWGYPANKSEYPMAAFFFSGIFPKYDFTLSFEDRGEAAGLHRYYDRQIARESTSQRITLSLRLAPHEFVSLFTPGTGAPDIRTVYLLDTGSGVVRAVVHTVGEYDPEASSVRCTFTRLTEN